MGGAFIAIADDATAASWNPGGLVQVELPELSVVIDTFRRTDDNQFRLHPESDGDQTVSGTDINYFSATWPFVYHGYNMVVSVNYQTLYDFTRAWKFPLITDSEGIAEKKNLDYQQDGNLSALGIAYSIQITPEFSMGLTLNLWDDDLGKNEWEQKISEHGSGRVDGLAFASESYSFHRYRFSGLNLNFGLLWNVTDQLTVGAVLKTPFEADLKHEYSFYHAVQSAEFPQAESTDAFSADETLDMPMSYGIGAAYRLSKNFTVSLDVYRTQWDDFIQTDSEGREFSPLTGKSPGESDISPTTQVRTGAEYLFITSKYIIPLCAGLFYDPAPAEGSPDDFFGFSIGSGMGWKQFHFDIAYQYRRGNHAGSSVLKEWGFSQNLEEHKIYSSLIIHF
jgi:long-subunit fatty acid transport protein